MFSERATQSTARRLRRTRQHLGSYRHELMIAIRVVNSVEREMIMAEWENWLLDENQQCRQVQMMLQEHRTSKPSKVKDAQRVLEMIERDRRMDELRTWQEDYCGSCRHEQDKLQQQRKYLTSR